MATNVPFFERLYSLQNAIVKQTDHRQAIHDWAAVLQDVDIRREFFKSLETTDWIAPLKQEGYFDKPPSVENVPSGGVRHPNWPASQYLAQMAKHSPQEVAEIFVGIETDNASVINDMLDASLVMPNDVARTLVPAICQAADAGTLWMCFKDACDLCVKLASGEETNASMQLAIAMFTPHFEKDRDKPSRRDEYWYKECLKTVVPVLASRKASEFIPKLCDWLRALIKAKNYSGSESGWDHSYVWRPAIEEHEQNKTYDFAGEMVGFVREGFEQAIKHSQLTLDTALAILDEYSYLIFKRLRLHLINIFAEQNLALAKQSMMSPELFNSYEFKHEYAMLVGDHLSILSKEDRKIWFGWVDDGPDMSDFDDSVRRNSKREATEEDRRRRIEYWQFQKLHLVRHHLDDPHKDFYQRMLEKNGEPELADLNVHRGAAHWGHDSPMEVADLQTMTFKEAVKKVTSWQADKPRFMGPDIEGLASTFKQYVALDPEGFSKQASTMVDRPSIYVRGFINQMSEAAKAGRKVDIPTILKLCHWVVGRPVSERTTPRQEHDVLTDKDWQWTRDDISYCVKTVCNAMNDEVPRYPLEELREPLWQAIEPLCRDRVESYVVRDLTEEDPRICDYLDLGINSPRGKAVEAALEYARWIANHIKQKDGEKEIVPGGFEAMPKVRAMLESQIDPKNSSFEVMSIIGSRIGVLYWIDKDWLGNHANVIFNLKQFNPQQYKNEPRLAHGWAAWNAYLVWGQPHIEFYKLFKDQFAYAVTQSSKVAPTTKGRQQPMQRLGEHLMVLYGRAQLGLDDDKGLLRRFLSDSLPEIRRRAIEFVGQSLTGNEKVPQEVTDRFMKLWDEYWPKHGRADAAQSSDRCLFGTWFSCGQFSEQWSLEQLEQLVEVVPTPEPDHAIAKRLAEIADTDINRSVRILDLIIQGDKEAWRVHTWLESATQILGLAMQADEEAQDIAKRIIDYLGRRGHTKFGELLKS